MNIFKRLDNAILTDRPMWKDMLFILGLATITLLLGAIIVSIISPMFLVLVALCIVVVGVIYFLYEVVTVKEDDTP